jgi:flagellar biogenesis protein FliO
MVTHSVAPAWQRANFPDVTTQPPTGAADNTVSASVNGLSSPAVNDSLVLPAVHAAVVDGVNAAPRRELAPPKTSAAGSSDGNLWQVRARLPLHIGLPSNAAYTIASALAIVVGLFLLFVWLLRRGSRGTAKSLPTAVVSVLGRVPIAPKQHADLLRVGNKLVLVAQSPSGPTTLTEVTDSIEVDRLVGLCQQADPYSTTKAFEQVFRQLAREPAASGFLGQEASFAAVSPPVDSFRQFRTEGARV